MGLIDNYDDKALVYDLRQIYAKDIIGESLKAIKIARTSENYPLWYHLLKRDLLTEISQKLNEEEIIKVRKQIKLTRDIIMKYPEAYLGKSHDSYHHELIEDALCELEMTMTKLMETHKMYGSKEDDEGL